MEPYFCKATNDQTTRSRIDIYNQIGYKPPRRRTKSARCGITALVLRICPGVGGSGDGGFREASVQGPNQRGSRSARGAPSSPTQCRRKRKMEGSVWRTEAVNRPPHEPPLIPPAPGRTTRPAPLRGCCPARAGFYPQIQQGVMARFGAGPLSGSG